MAGVVRPMAGVVRPMAGVFVPAVVVVAPVAAGCRLMAAHLAPFKRGPRPADVGSMLDKGYEHPLHCLDLLPRGSEYPDEPRFALPWPNGAHLVIRPELRRRAEDVPTSACTQAVDAALSRHSVAVARLAPFDLGADWADNVRFWTGRLFDTRRQRLGQELDLREQGHLFTGLLWRGRRHWVRLSLAVRMAGIDPTVVPVRGRPPHATLAFLDALTRAQRAARDPACAALLGTSGYGPEQQKDLAEIVTRLGEERQHRLDIEEAVRLIAAQELVLRGALIGDLSRLCMAAPHAFLPEQARALTMRRLFPRRSRPAQESAPAAPGLGMSGDPAEAPMAPQ